MAYSNKTLDMLDLKLLGTTFSLLGGRREDESRGQSISRALREGTQIPQKMQTQQLALDRASLQNQKLAMETAKLANEVGIGLNAKQQAEREYTRSQQTEDRLIPESFGAWDTLEVAAARAGSPFGIESEESLTAYTAKTELNKTILEVGAAAFTGRPSKFLLEVIKQTLPETGMQGDSLAYQKYKKIKDTFLSHTPKLQTLIDTAESNKDKLKYQGKLADVNYMVNRLDNVIGSFEDQGLGENEFYESPGLEAGQFSETDLKELEDLFRS